MAYKDKAKAKEYGKEWTKKNPDYQKAYREKNKEELKVKSKAYKKAYREKNKEELKAKAEVKRNTPKAKANRKLYLQKPKVKARIKEYCKENKEEIKVRMKKYHQKPKVKARTNTNNRNRYLNDKEFAIRGRLSGLLRYALNTYSKTGKIQSSNKYGMDIKAIIEHLKPFPDLSLYEVDHIVPLSWFNFNNPEEIRWAVEPTNHQWLTKEENRSKGNRHIYIKEEGGKK